MRFNVLPVPKGHEGQTPPCPSFSLSLFSALALSLSLYLSIYLSRSRDLTRT